MVARVQESEVKAIIETSLSVLPFIEVANLIVNEDLASSGLSEARKKQVELYLAAHFTSLSEERGGLISSKAGDATESYANNYGSGLLSTRYGQTAVALDSSGSLAEVATANKTARFTVV